MLCVFVSSPQETPLLVERIAVAVAVAVAVIARPFIISCIFIYILNTCKADLCNAGV
jgi:uncharacterized membrane protein (DUF485 family)